jgi:hypothetical protein
VVLWHGRARSCGLFAPCEVEPVFDFRDAYGGEVVVGIAIGGR